MTLLIYLFPAMIDILVGANLFVVSVRIALSQAGPVAVTLVVTLNATAYMLGSQVMGRLVTEKNAGKIIMISCSFAGLVSLLYVFIPGLKLVYLLVMMQAFVSAGFFVPFQVFMKVVESGKNQGIIKSTALYTLSWSGGLALGPLVAGYLWEATSWEWVFVLNALLAFLTVAGVFFIDKYFVNQKRATDADKNTATTAGPYSKMPNLVWVSWIFCSISYLVWMGTRSFFPSLGEYVKMPKSNQGEVLSLLLGAQAITGFCFYRSRTWMYEVLPMLCFGILGVLGVACFLMPNSVLWYYLGALLLGIYAGAFFFYFVFHAISHPTKSAKYVAVNESVNGVAGFIGPLLAGLLASNISYKAPYYFGASVIAVAIVVQAFIHRRYRSAAAQLRLEFRRATDT
ncbi:MAG: MFS transporter [Lentisphaerae bacterium]|nr:MFS transporter [Lentisphaerota bacterium]